MGSRTKVNLDSCTTEFKEDWIFSTHLISVVANHLRRKRDLNRDFFPIFIDHPYGPGTLLSAHHIEENQVFLSSENLYSKRKGQKHKKLRKMYFQVVICTMKNTKPTLLYFFVFHSII